MKRLVLDTNVLVSGFLWNGSPRRILTRIERRQDLLFVTRDLLVEFERVLAYPKIARVLAAAQQQPEDLIRWLAANATIVLPKPLDRVTVSDDPSDDAVLACAAAAGADVIVSGDKHLLTLAAYHGILIVSAGTHIRHQR